MAELRDWEIAATDNDDPPPNGFPEGMSYREVNDAARENMAVIARHSTDTSGSMLTTGTAAALNMAPSGSYAGTFSDGDRLSFRIHANIADSATLRVGTGLGVTDIPIHDKNGDVVEADAVIENEIVDVVYYSGAWRLVGVINPLPSITFAVRTGMVIPWAGTESSAPDGYLLCDGSALDRTTQSDLFTIIGSTYGDGDGISTFNLPDFRDRTIRGASTATALGDTGGSAAPTMHPTLTGPTRCPSRPSLLDTRTRPRQRALARVPTLTGRARLERTQSLPILTGRAPCLHRLAVTITTPYILLVTFSWVGRSSQVLSKTPKTAELTHGALALTARTRIVCLVPPRLVVVTPTQLTPARVRLAADMSTL